MIPVSAVAVLGDQLFGLAESRDFFLVDLYRVAVFILLWIDAGADCTVCCHCLILIASLFPLVPFLAVMNTLDDFRSHQRALCYNTFQRDHVIQML